MTFNESCVHVAKQVNNQLMRLVTEPIEKRRALDSKVKYPPVYGLQTLNVTLRPEICVMASGPVLVATAIGWPTEHMKEGIDWADDEMAVWFFNVTDQVGFMPNFFPHIAKIPSSYNIKSRVTMLAVKKQAHQAITESDHKKLGVLATNAALAQMLNRGVKI